MKANLNNTLNKLNQLQTYYGCNPTSMTKEQYKAKFKKIAGEYLNNSSDANVSFNLEI